MLENERLLLTFLAELPSLSRFFRRATGSALVAEDLAQDAWLRLVNSQAAELKKPTAYLRRISSNLATDFARRKFRRQLTIAEIDDILDVADPAPDPEAALIAKDSLRNLIIALGELPPRRRAILLAARLERIPHVVIAEAHGVSTRTVEVEIRKAMEHCTRAVLDL